MAKFHQEIYFEVCGRKLKLHYSIFSRVSNRQGNFRLLVLSPGTLINIGSISRGGCSLSQQSCGGSSSTSLKKYRKGICK